MWQIWCSLISGIWLSNGGDTNSFFMKSQSDWSIVLTSHHNLSEMTSVILLAALCFSKNAALNWVLSNDFMKGLTLIALDCAGWFTQWTKSSRPSAGLTRELHYPRSHKNTHWLHTNPQSLGYLFSLETNLIKCIKWHSLEEGWYALWPLYPHVWVWLFMGLTFLSMCLPWEMFNVTIKINYRPTMKDRASQRKHLYNYRSPTGIDV